MNNSDDYIDPFADNTLITPDDDVDPFADEYTPDNPIENVELGENLEEGSIKELNAIISTLTDEDAKHRAEVKAALQQQDKNQQQQFRNLYDTNFYFSEVYKTADECEQAKRIQARILGIDYEQAGVTFYRRGDVVMKAFMRIAEQLNIDISDLI